MFCSKCGKELMNEAVVCPNCGCATSNYGSARQAAQQPASAMYSENYPALKAFADQAKTLKNLGIVAAILCCGIGIIFSIIIWVKSGGGRADKIPNLNLSLPQEIAEYEAAKKNWKLALLLSLFPIWAILIAFLIGMLIAPFLYF